MESNQLPRVRFLRKPTIFLGRDDCAVNKEFLRSAAGLLKIGQTVTLTTSILSLARYVILTSTVTKVDCVFFVSAVSLCLVVLGLFLLFLFHCHEKVACRKSALNVAVAVFSGVSSGLMLISSIILTREAVEVTQQLSTASYDNSKEKCETCSRVNTAAIFGYLSWILFAVDFVLLLRRCGKTASTAVHAVVPRTVTENEQEEAV